MPISRKAIEVVKATAPVVAPHALEITSTFYKRMFENNPEVLRYFNKSHQREGRQPRALADSVIAFATHIENLDAINPAVDKIAARHVALSIKPEHYGIVHQNLMLAIGEVLGDAVTPEIGQGWNEAVLGLAEICINAEEKLYQGAESRKGGWRYERDFVVSRKDKVAEDTVQFQFTAADGYNNGFEFTPGQYSTVRVPQLGAPRHYTITSRPNDPFFEITTRLVHGGEYSTFLHDHLKVGDNVLLGAPMGIFVATQSEKPMFLISAGIGKTPMSAFLRSLPHEKIAGAIHVETDRRRFAFREDFENGNLPFFKFCETGEGKADVISLAEEAVANVGTEADFFLCGPSSFMAEFEAALEKQGCKSIVSEVFGTGGIRSNEEAEENMNKQVNK